MRKFISIYSEAINRREKTEARRQNINFFAAILAIAAYLLCFLLLSGCQKTTVSSNPSSAVSGDTLRVNIVSNLNANDSIYYSVNLPCLAPNQKTGYSRNIINTWKCKGSPTGAFYVISAQSNGSLIAPDSLSIEVFVNGTLKASGKNINTIAVAIQF